MNDPSSSDDDDGVPLPKTELELLCRVDRCFGIPREVGLSWMEAARYGDMNTIRSWIKSKKQPEDSQPKYGKVATPLQRLLHYNGQGTSYGFIGSTALHWACANGDLAMAQLLLKEGSSVNVQNRGGSTALHAACAHGQAKLVQLLLTKGANPQLLDVCNDTPKDVVPADAPDSRLIAQLLQIHQTANKLLQSLNQPADWSVQQMKQVLLAVVAFRNEAELPKERSELEFATLDALKSFQQLQEEAAQSAAQATLLHTKAFRRVERQRQKLFEKKEEKKQLKRANNEGTSSDDDDTEMVQMIQRSQETKVKGNEAFQSEDYKGAIRLYTAALGMSPYPAHMDNASIYSNRSAAYLKLRLPIKALQDAQQCVAINPDWPKGYHRVGAAALAMGRSRDAVEAYKAGLELAPEDPTLMTGLTTALQMSARDESEDEDEEEPPEVPKSPPAPIPSNQRHPWFECGLCDNRTRDAAYSPCCNKLLCGTCMKRSGGRSCPFGICT